MCSKGKALRANHRKSEGQASRTIATSDAQEQRGKRQAAGEKGGNDARETRQRTPNTYQALAWQWVIYTDG
jgi:hypothetical protein